MLRNLNFFIYLNLINRLCKQIFYNFARHNIDPTARAIAHIFVVVKVSIFKATESNSAITKLMFAIGMTVLASPCCNASIRKLATPTTKKEDRHIKRVFPQVILNLRSRQSA